MKRSALAGLFVTAAMLASPAFAADKTANLCQANLDKINNQKAETPGASGEAVDIDAAVQQAKAALAAGDEEKCIVITAKALQDLENTSKGGQ